MLLHGKETARLRIRNLIEADISSWFEFTGNPEAVKYFGDIGDPEEFARTVIERQLKRYQDHGFGLYALVDKQSDELVGMCGPLIQEIEGKTYIEVGYHLLPRHWKKGYATEAATFFRNYIFENKLDIEEKVISLIHVDNKLSQSVAKRNGMKKGITVTFKGLPHVTFEIKREDWESIKDINRNTMPLIKPVNGVSPKFGSDCYLAENCTVVGDVEMGDQCSIWFNAVVRGDVNSIRMGNKVNVQDGAVIHCTYQKTRVHIGDNVSIGHNAIVHGCTIQDNVLIGMGAIVMDNCEIGSNSIIAAGAVLLENTKVEAGSVWAGVPAKKVKDINPELLKGEVERIANNYLMYSGWFKSV